MCLAMGFAITEEGKRMTERKYCGKTQEEMSQILYTL